MKQNLQAYVTELVGAETLDSVERFLSKAKNEGIIENVDLDDPEELNATLRVCAPFFDQIIRKNCDTISRIETKLAQMEAMREWRWIISILLDSPYTLFADLKTSGDWMIAPIGSCLSEERFKAEAQSVGCVYILDLPGGVKVGKTTNLFRRISFHVSAARNLGVPLKRFAFSPFSANYGESEEKIHNDLRDFCVDRSEFFCIPFDGALNVSMPYSVSEPKGYEVIAHKVREWGITTEGKEA